MLYTMLGECPAADINDHENGILRDMKGEVRARERERESSEWKLMKQINHGILQHK